MTMSTIRIDPRFRGPRLSGNGGVTCGLVAQALGAASAEITLRAPPPLGVDLVVSATDQGVAVHHGDTLIATGRPAEVDVSPPAPPSFADAVAAMAGYRNREHHPLPECFVCGTARDEGDGLRIHPGPVGDGEVVAAGWTPTPDLGDEAGRVRTEVLWGALDCPSFMGLGMHAPFALLGRLSARVDRQPLVDQPCVVVGWTIAPRDGRKMYGGSALYTEDGELLGVGQGTWIVVDRAQVPS